jgi:hypothetical protein
MTTGPPQDQRIQNIKMLRAVQYVRFPGGPPPEYWTSSIENDLPSSIEALPRARLRTRGLVKKPVMF